LLAIAATATLAAVLGGFDAFDPRAGAAVGKYRPFRRLAVGGMAEIYLAYARSLAGFEKLVVLKRVLPQHSENAEFMRMFLDEARLAATLDHPNIVHVYDIGEHAGSFFFAMEYVHGQSLLRIMRQITSARRWLPVEHALGIVIGTCAGLHHAHDKVGLDGQPLGIVHRDVSPPNILISYDGAVKVADFGIAKAASMKSSTGVGTLKGKIPYMSPEQCKSEPLDRRSDVFSIGILLYELTVGRRLFQADSEIGIIHKVVHGVVPPPSTLLRGYPEELERIVLKALQVHPDLRYPSARALQIDLEEFARDHRVAISSARLAAFMEELFDAETRRWPSDPTARPTGGEGSGASAPFTPTPRTITQVTPSPSQITPTASRMAPATPDDFAAIDAALARMIGAETDVDVLTSPLGDDAEDPDDDWIGLDRLELEELFPAKHGRDQ